MWSTNSRSDVSREQVIYWNSLPDYYISSISLVPLPNNAHKNKDGLYKSRDRVLSKKFMKTCLNEGRCSWTMKVVRYFERSAEVY